MDTTKFKAQRGAPQAATPTWVRLTQLESLRGIKKGTAYNLIHAGAIQSVRLPNTPTKDEPKTEQKQPTKGVRLVNLDSVDKFLNGLLTEQANT